MTPKTLKGRRMGKFELTPPCDMEEIAEYLCAKRRRRLVYEKSDELFSREYKVVGTGGKNYEGIGVQKIIAAEIKEGVRLGRIEKYDGLSAKELKEEYADESAYEYAGQELSRAGLLLNGETVEVYVFDWDIHAFHHVGYLEGEEVEDLKKYLEEPEKYTFDVSAMITGGNFKSVKTCVDGKFIIEKGSDGDYGLDLDVVVLPRID